MITRVLTFLFSCFLAINLISSTRLVPSQYNTIQLALSACLAGDTVLVQPGTYIENLIWPNIANIKLISTGNATNTIIDANFSGRCITITPTNTLTIDTNTVVEKFKLRNGYLNALGQTGSAIYSTGNGLSIKACDIIDNEINISHSQNSYSALDARGSLLIIYNSIISNNKTTTFGFNNSYIINCNEIKLYDSFVNSNILNTNDTTAYNYMSSSVLLVRSNFDLKRTVIQNNVINMSSMSNSVNADGSLIYSSITYSLKNASIVNCLITDNKTNVVGSGTSTWHVGQIYIREHANAYFYIKSSTICNNSINNTTDTIYHNVISYLVTSTLPSMNCYVPRVFVVENSIIRNAPNSREIYIDVPCGYGPRKVVNSNINMPTSTATFSNCINTNPLFVSATDFHLQSSSPCVSAGIMDTLVVDDLEHHSRPFPMGTNPDMGCYEINQFDTGVRSNNALSDFLIFPSPVTDKLYFNNDKKIDKLEVINLQGQIVIIENNPDNSVDCQNLNNGVYFLKIYTKNDVKTMKFMKQ